MLPALDISTSALVAQRARMNAISSNLANMSTTHNEAGELEPIGLRRLVLTRVARPRLPDPVTLLAVLASVLLLLSPGGRRTAWVAAACAALQALAV